MRRRQMLLTAGAALVGASAFPLRWARAAGERKRRILYFTRSVGFEHSVVHREGNALSYSEKILIEFGHQLNAEVVCTKDGRVFDDDLDKFDAIAFYSCGDLLNPESKDKNPPMSPEGKARLLAAIGGGTGFVGFHSASDSFHSKGEANAVQSDVDPYVAMLGGEFIKHGPQQVATTRVTSPEFPGLKGLGSSFSMNEEWYALKNFAKDMHVVLVQETAGMKGACYQRPPFPATWARRHGKGRVFFTSLGHREDVWTGQPFRKIVLGGFAWAIGDVEADLTPNLDRVTPQANVLSPEL